MSTKFNFNLTDNYNTRITDLNDTLKSLSKLDFIGLEGDIPVGAKRINPTTYYLEEWNGSAWEYGTLNFGNELNLNEDITINKDQTPSIFLNRNETGTTFQLAASVNDVVLAANSGKGMLFYTNDLSRMYIKSNGYVGLGTNSPVYNLDIQSIVGSPYLRIYRNAGSGDGYLRMGADSVGSVFFSADENQNPRMFRWLVGDIDGTCSEVMRLNEYGNLGIGTDSPLARLNVVSDDSYPARFGTTTPNSFINIYNSVTGTTTLDGLVIGIDSNADAYIINRENSSLRFSTNNSEKMRIDPLGNVGIGRIPITKLDVYVANGNVSQIIESGSGVKGFLEAAGATLFGIGTISNDPVALYTNGTEKFRITYDGKISTGVETSPDVDAGGICLNQGSGNGNILTLKSSDVTHGATNVSETDTYGFIKKEHYLNGGLNITGLSQSVTGLYLKGIQTNGSPSTGCVRIDTGKISGTSLIDVNDGDLIFEVNNNDSNALWLYGNGVLAIADGSTTLHRVACGNSGSFSSGVKTNNGCVTLRIGGVEYKLMTCA